MEATLKIKNMAAVSLSVVSERYIQLSLNYDRDIVRTKTANLRLNSEHSILTAIHWSDEIN
jgi:hypothetical protein